MTESHVVLPPYSRDWLGEGRVSKGRRKGSLMMLLPPLQGEHGSLLTMQDGDGTKYGREGGYYWTLHRISRLHRLRPLLLQFSMNHDNKNIFKALFL